MVYKTIKQDNHTTLRHYGYDETNKNYKMLFSDEVIEMIIGDVKRIISKYNGDEFKIKLSKNTIINVLSSVHKNYKPPVQDMFSIHNNSHNYNKLGKEEQIIKETIELVSKQCINELETIKCNSKLSKWNTLLGDFNKLGLRSHDQIKLRNRRPASFQFNMKY
jgi:hypothetical protein